MYFSLSIFSTLHLFHSLFPNFISLYLTSLCSAVLSRHPHHIASDLLTCFINLTASLRIKALFSCYRMSFRSYCTIPNFSFFHFLCVRPSASSCSRGLLPLFLSLSHTHTHSLSLTLSLPLSISSGLASPFSCFHVVCYCISVPFFLYVLPLMISFNCAIIMLYFLCPSLRFYVSCTNSIFCQSCNFFTFLCNLHIICQCFGTICTILQKTRAFLHSFDFYTKESQLLFA